MRFIISEPRSALARRVRFSPAAVSGHADVIEAADMAYRRKRARENARRFRSRKPQGPKVFTIDGHQVGGAL